MKIQIGNDFIIVTNPTKDQSALLYGCETDDIRVTDMVRGIRVKGNPAILFNILLQLSYKYDIELI